MSKLSIQQYLDIVRTPETEHLRRGQNMMRTLRDYSEELYSVVTFDAPLGTDPFYLDENIPRFLAFLVDYVELP